MNNTVLRRLSAVVASSALAITGLTLVAAPAHAVDPPTPRTRAADWLKGQLTNGLIHSPNYGGYDDYGLSIDTALALDSVDGYESDVATIGNAIRNNYYNYAMPFGVIYAGGVAKALVLAQIAGTEPASYPVALKSDLESRTSGSAPIAGRIENLNETSFPSGDPTDTANVIGQSLAARALTVAGSSEAAAAVTFLLSQQCAAGFFREKFTADKFAGDQTCDGAAPAATPSVDATAQAIINLRAAGVSTPAAQNAYTAAYNWLLSVQDADGSFNGHNANSTGLASAAITEFAIGPGDVVRAGDWLRAHQADPTDACTKLAGNIGAIGYNDASVAAGRANGIPTTAVNNGIQDEWRRSTAQALFGLKYWSGGLPPVISLSGPTGYVQASKPANYTVNDANPNSKLCLKTGSSVKLTTANGSGDVTAALTLPAGTASRTVTVVDRDGNSASWGTSVLGIKTLSVTPAARRIKRGGSVKVTVAGLAPGEAVKLYYRGVLTFTGTATGSGTFVRTVRVRRVLGFAKIAATGQFPTIRKGSTTIKVIR